MKWVKRIGIGLVVLLVVVALVANFYLGAVVKTVVERAGPMVVGVPLMVEDVHFRLMRGFVRLQGFSMGNPEGFKTDHAISVGEVIVELNMRSLLRDTIVIRRIYVKAPQITYELGLGRSNIGVILDQMGGEAGAEEPKDEAGGKKVIIEDFLIEDGMVRLSARMAMGVAAPIPLPDIHLTDIGKDSGSEGASPVQVVRRILGAIVQAAGGVVTGSVGLVGDGVEGVGKGAAKAAGAVGDGAGKLLGGLKDLVPGGGEGK